MSVASTTISTVMRGVAEALKLDGDNRVQEAYMKYLECVLRICTKLLQDARLGGNLSYIINKETVKMVRLGQQCMERITAVVNQIDTQTNSVDSLQLQMPYRPSGTRSEPCTPSDHFPPVKSPAFINSMTIPKEQSPLEQAYKQNQQLMMAYKARLARLDPKRRMATSLTVQRKMAENLAIAKVQEEALTKKMNERQQRLEEQAARRFGTPTGLTDDDKEQRQIYKKVLEFEQESTKFTDLRKELEEKPNDPELINKLIENITSTPDHPLTQKMKTQQTRILDKLQHLVADKLNILDQIKVPLSESLYPEHHFKKEMEEGTSFKEEGTSSKESEGNKDNRVGDQTDNKMDEKDEEKEEGCEEGIDVKKDIHVKYEDEDSDDNGPGESWEPGYQGETSDIVNTADNLQTDLKEDIEKAIDMGDKECEKLETNVRKAKGILHQISQEYDKYNQDNMDDLFDEDENYDEIEEKDIQTNDQLKIINKKDDTEIANSASLSDLKSIEMKIRDLKNEAYQRHIKAISEDIHMYLEKMLVLFTVCYEELDCVTGKDQCYACLEESIFKPVWRYLLALFRLANEPKELALAHVMTEKMSCDPVDCNVSAKLQLANCDTPYDTVVTHLQTLPNQQTLLSKLECLVKCSRLVCQCIEDYYSNQKIPTIGADDLLPILCFVIIKAGHPEILSECLILEEFIHEGYIMGEEGYCLTSIQTAVGYLVSQGMTT